MAALSSNSEDSAVALQDLTRCLAEDNIRWTTEAVRGELTACKDLLQRLVDGQPCSDVHEGDHHTVAYEFHEGARTSEDGTEIKQEASTKVVTLNGAAALTELFKSLSAKGATSLDEMRNLAIWGHLLNDEQKRQ
eukprot:3918924-Amphidinium_carterae.1